MTREEARQFKARWQLVNDVIAEEMRRAPAAFKLRQLALMYEAGQTLGWAAELREGELEVHERWRCLKEKIHV